MIHPRPHGLELARIQARRAGREPGPLISTRQALRGLSSVHRAREPSAATSAHVRVDHRSPTWAPTSNRLPSRSLVSLQRKKLVKDAQGDGSACGAARAEAHRHLTWSRPGLDPRPLGWDLREGGMHITPPSLSHPQGLGAALTKPPSFKVE